MYDTSWESSPSHIGGLRGVPSYYDIHVYRIFVVEFLVIAMETYVHMELFSLTREARVM